MKDKIVDVTPEEIEDHLKRNTKLAKRLNEEVSYGVYFPYEGEINPIEECVDVYIKKGKEEYWGTFITVKKIKECFDRYKTTGENENGAYFEIEKMIVVEEITDSVLERSIRDLLKTKRLEQLFEKKRD